MAKQPSASVKPGKSKKPQPTPSKVKRKIEAPPVKVKRDDVPKLHSLSPESRALRRKLQAQQPASPKLSGGDIDAAWEQADGGEETVGGTVATPDQDRVDELGEAVGLTYRDDEPLNVGEKLDRRDRERWELDPASAADESVPEIEALNEEAWDEDDLEELEEDLDEVEEWEALEEEDL